jgi:hypothetical protein
VLVMLAFKLSNGFLIGSELLPWPVLVHLSGHNLSCTTSSPSPATRLRPNLRSLNTLPNEGLRP